MLLEKRHCLGAATLVALVGITSLGWAAPPKPEFPPFDSVTKDYTKVAPPPDSKPLYTIYTRKKDGQMLAELPRSYAGKWFFFAMTVASGERFAGLQSNDQVVYWKRYGKRLALLEPNLGTRSNGDQESKSSVKRLFTDRVLLDIPILTIRPGGGPVIDMDELLLGKASVFFGGSARGMNRRLAEIKTAKAFPQNVEIGYEVPMTGGTLKTLHYSISSIPNNPKYKPRKADERVGFFTTSYTDLGAYTEDDKQVRYINRWHLEKADPKLKLSPPKRPIIFYIEHTTPVRYRRFVADGVLSWNRAFEKIGITNAVEVRYQDAVTGEHMDKDPEDVRYNFVRWLNNDISTAIGPSRVHPKTGEILDADIVLTDGWIRVFEFQFTRQLPQIAMEGFGPDTLAWLEKNPEWDPRICLAPEHARQTILSERAQRGTLPFAGHPMGNVDHDVLGDDEYDGLVGRVSQVNGLCHAATGKAFDLTILRMTLGMRDDEKKENEEEDDEEADDAAIGDNDVLDGIPAKFIGPLLADLVAHEAGHTLGLRHNFKASGLYTQAEINSEEVRGKKPFTGSVMDYNPININMDSEAIQGDYAMIDIGPYDYWAIEYGYTFEKDLKPILARCVERENAYATDEDTFGPDPLARRYDFATDPHAFAENQMRLANYHRERILDQFVKDGDSWAKARQGYDMTLGLQMSSLSIMANWVGGSYVNRDKKGDKGNRPPIQPVPAKMQRTAMEFCIENSFPDESFGLSKKLLSYMTLDKWMDGGFFAMFQDPTYPIHDRISGVQSSVLSMLMNPTTLGRLYDNEWRAEDDEDCVTLAELLDSVYDAAWSELDQRPNGGYTTRKPMISSLRRNLQQSHLSRLISLAMREGRSPSYRAISTLSLMQLGELKGRIESTLGQAPVDAYTKAHLTDAARRITKALEAQYVVTH